MAYAAASMILQVQIKRKLRRRSRILAGQPDREGVLMYAWKVSQSGWNCTPLQI